MILPGETCLRAVASALFERANVDTGPAGSVEREGYDGELAACVDAVASASDIADVAACADAAATASIAVVASGRRRAARTFGRPRFARYE